MVPFQAWGLVPVTSFVLGSVISLTSFHPGRAGLWVCPDRFHYYQLPCQRLSRAPASLS